MYLVYVLKSSKTGKRYIGYTNNISRRLNEHNNATRGFSLRHKPFYLIFKKEFTAKKETLAFEKYSNKLKGGEQFKKILGA
jgi:putative endonuclease